MCLPIAAAQPGCRLAARTQTAGSHSARALFPAATDRKSTRLNSSHLVISYAVFCLKKKKTTTTVPHAPPRRFEGRCPYRHLARRVVDRGLGADVRLKVVPRKVNDLFSFFFLNDPAPPETPPFPPHSSLPT